MDRAFGIAATSDREAVTRIAGEVEQLGYSTLWTNDTPMADGLACAEQIAHANPTLRIGIGVIAVDRRPIKEWVNRLADMPVERLTVGVGAGLSDHPMQTVREAVAELRDIEPTLKIAVAAMGPRMVNAAGEVADVVLLNWMTPGGIDWARQLLAGSTAKVAAYVRASSGPEAREVIAAEAGRYLLLPHYRRHFDAMTMGGADPEDVGVILGQDALDPYESRLDETVVRGISANPNDTEGLLRLVREAAPAGT